MRLVRPLGEVLRLYPIVGRNPAGPGKDPRNIRAFTAPYGKKSPQLSGALQLVSPVRTVFLGGLRPAI